MGACQGASGCTGARVRSALWCLLQRGVAGFKDAEGHTPKKTLKYKKRDPHQRLAYRQALCRRIQEHGSANLVYVDETGVAPETCRAHGWSARGQKVQGEHAGRRWPRTHLMAARRGPDFFVTLLFQGSVHTELAHTWMRQKS